MSSADDETANDQSERMETSEPGQNNREHGRAENREGQNEFGPDFHREISAWNLLK